VQSPIVIGVGSRELTVTWQPPATPNGIITIYTLYANDFVVFSGTNNITIVTSLLPFAEYNLILEACTAIGCANSSRTISQTLPDAPSDLDPPVLTVLGPSSIMATWQLPRNTNGVIIRIELRLLLGLESAFQVVFNDINLDLETTITGLVPNTLYTFQLVAFNAGGSVSSPVVQGQTLEDIPDDISPPSVDTIGGTYLEVSWLPPGIPNGDIIQYNLTLNGDIIFTTAQDFSYNITDLRPFTVYSLAIIACTVRGCGSSNQSTARTSEAVPTGYVAPTILSISPLTISVAVNPVTSENGVANYILYISGSFLSTDTMDSVEAGQRVVFNGSAPSGTQNVGQLVPFTNYSLFLEVSNGAGTFTGPTFYIETSPTGELP
jgi:usherin